MLSEGLKILYVEDNLGDKVILEEYLLDILKLKSLVHCSTIKDSITVIKQNTFDLIFLDLSLPDTQGIDGVSQLIKKTQSAIPIIVLTGLNDHSVALETLKVGAQDFLVKGDYNKTTLSKAIRYSIERNKVQHELFLRNKEIMIAKNRLSKAEEMAELGSWEINLNTEEVKLSNGMKHLLGLNKSIEKVSLVKFGGYISSNDKGTYIDSLLNGIDGSHSAEIELNFLNEKGKFVNTVCKAEVHFDEKNRPIEIYGVNLDVSKIKEAEKVKEEFTNELAKKVTERTLELEKTKAKLEESLLKEKELGELKSRFVSTASHQFRTPLTVIQSNIGLLEMQSQTMNSEHIEIIEKVVGRVKREVKRMTNIMNEVLILGKISSGIVTPVFKEVSVISVCKHVIKQHNQIQEDGRRANVEITGSEKEVMLDKNLFEQAVSNMVSNAFKYSKGNEAPSLSIAFEENEVIIEVQDKGMGIPENDLKDLFTPFYRASNVLDIPGNGLGTSIMKEYIELNKGTLKAESTLNKGTSFSITFKVN
jgi:signal transduction histidine kinase/DNA-binding response OmpR family regulator